MGAIRSGFAVRVVALSLLAGAALGGCSYVPDWANPGEWFSDDAPPPPPRRSSGKPVVGASKQAQQPAPSGEERPYPDLASTPERPQPQTTESQRREIQRGLIADRENARYSDPVPVGRDAGRAAPPAPPPALPSLAAAPPRAVSAAPIPAPAPPAPPAPTQAEEPREFSPSRPAMAEPPRPSPTTTPPSPAPLTTPAASPAPANRVAAVPQPVPPASAPLGSAAAPAAMQPAPPPQSVIPPRPAAPAVNLPIGQDQQTLAQTFSAHVAAQASPYAPPGAPVMIGESPAAPAAAAAPTRLAALGAPGEPIAIITFPHGGAQLGADDLQTVRRIAEAAEGHGGVVRVVGHASQRTGNMSMERHRLVNFNVSFERAQAVARALRRAGVDPQRIIVEAVGDSQPRYYEFMPNGEAENRRVEIFLE